LAENITNPTTILENPHWDEFDRELDEGYDYVGFQLKSLHTPKIARMMKLIREKCPDTKIIVGGYGVNALRHDMPGDTAGDGQYIRENADYLCREEGVRYMRKILGDEPIDREITQYKMPMPGFVPAGLDTNFRNPMILVALGCPNACDFCNTSAMFDHKKIYVADPQQVVKFAKHIMTRLGTKNIVVTLYDEDFFINKDYARELGRLLREDKEMWGFKYFTFGSVRSLSQYEPEEIRDNGCGGVWIGVESFMCGQEHPEDNYAKRKGNEIKKLFEDLQRNGIHTTASIILGLDFHTRENLKEDLDQFIDLKPGAYQISPLLPCPGTELFERLNEEERIVDTYKWEDFHLWSGAQFKPKNLTAEEIKEFYDYAHDELYNRNGPSIVGSLENSLDCYQLLKKESSEFHKYRAGRSKGMAEGTITFLRAVKDLHPSETVQEKVRDLEKRFNEEIGPPPLVTRLISRYLSMQIKRKYEKEKDKQIISDPPVRWSYYNTFDDRVWVKKGRDAKEPVPYYEPKSKSLPLKIARFVRPRG
jgi:haloalkane dehalogenase